MFRILREKIFGAEGAENFISKGDDAFTNREFSTFFIGVHGPHTEYEDFLLDVKKVLLCKPRGAKVVRGGDWITDILPGLPDDPWVQERN